MIQVSVPEGCVVYDALIVVNGEIPSLKFWQGLLYRTIICTDGAANTLRDFSITPDIIIGDMDSISDSPLNATAMEGLKEHFSTATIHHLSDQHSTDFEKALNYALQQQYKRILCLGILGKSADHGLYNLNLLNRYSQHMEIMALNTFEDSRQWIFRLGQNMRIHTKKHNIVSFFPFPEATLSSQGLIWELSSTLLTQTGKGAIRNRANAESLVLSCQGDCLCFLISEEIPQLVTTKS